MRKVLIIGACGQLGSELTLSLRERIGNENVIASDLRGPIEVIKDGPFEIIDALKKEELENAIKQHSISEIYHLAAILSAKGEQNPKFAWDVNMTTLLNVLELAKDYNCKVYWPSSIAVFGSDTPKEDTPQKTIMNPSTVYGISKLAGERWCEYYFEKYGVDVRSLRYPGLIGYKGKPGGGTTDYAVDIYWKAKEGERFNCFLKSDTVLPMMFMEDAVRATIELMESPMEKISVRSSYNLAAISVTPIEIFLSIKKDFGSFEIEYNPDFRQDIADSWPNSIDDMKARTDWGWTPSYDLQKMTEIMLENIKPLTQVQ
ncbi:MAG: nucleoside-diphosphate-sugar epimerase [Cyclobacteriaceae bacterium]|jgi:nucleoside-diphosphate-sugar epimerase